MVKSQSHITWPISNIWQRWSLYSPWNVGIHTSTSPAVPIQSLDLLDCSGSELNSWNSSFFYLCFLFCRSHPIFWPHNNWSSEIRVTSSCIFYPAPVLYRDGLEFWSWVGKTWVRLGRETVDNPFLENVEDTSPQPQFSPNHPESCW